MVFRALRRLLVLWALFAAWFLAESHRQQREARASGSYLRVAFHGGVQERISGRWSGGAVQAVFGGAELDLREADLPAKGAILDARAFCGGIRLVVPHHWDVRIDGMPVFGGLSNVHAGDDDGPRLTVHARVVCGGLRVDNGEPITLLDEELMDVEE